MAGELEIRQKVDTAEAKKLIERLSGTRAFQAMSVAVNDTARQVERKAESLVAKTLSVPRKRADLGIFVRPYSTPKTLSATVRGSASVIPLKAFNAREEGPGVVAKIWGAKVMHPGAFIMGGQPGERVPLNLGGHVFNRVGKKRLPIEKSKGASISEAMAKDAVSSANETYAAERLQANVMRQLARYARVRNRQS